VLSCLDFLHVKHRRWVSLVLSAILRIQEPLLSYTVAECAILRTVLSSRLTQMIDVNANALITMSSPCS